MLTQLGMLLKRLYVATLRLIRPSQRSSAAQIRILLDIAWARMAEIDRKMAASSVPDRRMLTRRSQVLADWSAQVQEWAKCRSKQLRQEASSAIHQQESNLKDKLRAIRRGKAIAGQLQELAARADRLLASAVQAQSTLGLTDFAHSVVNAEAQTEEQRGSPGDLMRDVQVGLNELMKAMGRARSQADDGYVLRVANACPRVATPYRDGFEFWGSSILKCSDKLDACVQAREDLEELISDLQHIDLGLCREEKATWASIRELRKPFLDAAYRELPAEWLQAARIRVGQGEQGGVMAGSNLATVE